MVQQWSVESEADATVFTFGGVKVELSSAQDASSNSPCLSTSVWAASILLSRYLTERTDLLAGKRILELGCGQALPGLLAASLQACTVRSGVTLTDCSCKGLHILRERCESAWKRQGKGWKEWEDDAGFVKIRRHVWEADIRKSEDDEQTIPETIRHWSNGDGDTHEVPFLDVLEVFDVILASDVIYFSSQIEPLVHTVRRRLAPGGCAYLVITIRECRTALFRQLRDVLENMGLAFEEGDFTFDSDEVLATFVTENGPHSSQQPTRNLSAAAKTSVKYHAVELPSINQQYSTPTGREGKSEAHAVVPFKAEVSLGQTSGVPLSIQSLDTSEIAEKIHLGQSAIEKLSIAPSISSCSDAGRGLEEGDFVLITPGEDGEEVYTIDLDAGTACPSQVASETTATAAQSVHFTRTEVGWKFLRVTHRGC